MPITENQIQKETSLVLLCNLVEIWTGFQKNLWRNSSIPHQQRKLQGKSFNHFFAKIKL